MPNKTHSIRLIGRLEYVDFPLLELANIEAKIDTGAYTSSIHCENISVKNNSGDSFLHFTIVLNDPAPVRKEYVFKEFAIKKIKNSFGEMEERYIIKTLLKIGKKNIHVSLSLSNRDSMRYPVLIGRKPLKGKFLIDVKRVHVGGQKADLAIIDLLLK
jgi:hypothetical protein